jgi:hypothetical protein
LALERRTVTIESEAESGEIERLSVEIDETLPVAVETRTIADWTRAARADWAALTWLCWSVGLDRVALPERLSAPADFAAAAATAVARCWRAHDRLATGGLYAMSRGTPGFTWEGIDIDEMPRQLLPLVAREYLEIRSVFLWLLDPTEISPFQRDLREA